MNQPLPTGGFKWVTPDEISRLVSKGYLLEVDVRYPKELHDSHDDLPFTFEKMEINKVAKLVPNLYNKEKYAIHSRALDQALKHGLILEKVHRIIEFNQSAWLKPYIDFNKDLRTKAKNDFEKDFFKLMNNSVQWRGGSEAAREAARLMTPPQSYFFCLLVWDAYYVVGTTCNDRRSLNTFEWMWVLQAPSSSMVDSWWRSRGLALWKLQRICILRYPILGLILPI